MATLEVVSIPGTISGSSIIHDLCNRIADKLSRDCCLRAIDVYSGYSYRVTLELQLNDVYPTTVAVEVATGRIDPKLEVQHIELGSDITAAQPEDVNLERPVDPDGFIEAPVKEKRYYTPRNAQPLSDKTTLWAPPKA
jgi:hypothetical protein